MGFPAQSLLEEERSPAGIRGWEQRAAGLASSASWDGEFPNKLDMLTLGSFSVDKQRVAGI